MPRSIARFLEAVRGGDPGAVPCTPRDALGTLRVALACERALESGTVVSVP
jgi:predicted dehydrogenase